MADSPSENTGLGKAEPGAAVILGGFLSHPSLYADMKRRIAELSGDEVYVVPVTPLLWLLAILPWGWVPILLRLDRVLTGIQNAKSDVKVTLIGHSIGGVLGRLYHVSPPVFGHTWEGRKSIGQIITLGSPHSNRCRWFHGGYLSRIVERWSRSFPLPEKVAIVCVAGKKIFGSKQGVLQQRQAWSIYEKIAGNGELWGDGIIPVKSALLPGTRHIVLEDVGHFSRSGEAWYGSAGIVTHWWEMIAPE